MKTICRICNSKIKSFFNLGRHPLANSLLKSKNEKEKKYPLELAFCPSCSLVQLNHTVSPKKLFSNYVWVTGTSSVAKSFANVFYEELIKRTPEAKKNYVLEIASNDGTFLRPFIKNGFNAVGIDPAKNIAEIAQKDGVPTINKFWSSDTARDLLREHGPARAIFARNVLAHVANLKNFVGGLAIALHKEGTLAVEVHYAGEILRGLQYDSIYHEHLCYFTFESIEKLLNKFGFFVFDAVKSPISGGAITVYAAKKPRAIGNGITKFRNEEKKQKSNLFATWKNFAKMAFEHKKKFVSLLSQIQKTNTAVVGWGASARSSTLLNFCGINSSFIPVIADKSDLKHGLYTAGSKISIKSPDEAMKLFPKHVVILGWNFSEEIKKELKEKFGYKGKYIIPLPSAPKII